MSRCRSSLQAPDAEGTASNPSAADYVFVAEIYTGRVPRSQLFVLSRDGSLVHGSSVHWGHDPPTDLSDTADGIVARFLQRATADTGAELRGVRSGQNNVSSMDEMYIQT